MMLAIETATAVCSVALMDDEGQIIEKRIEGRSVHSDHLFLFARDLIRQKSLHISDLDAILMSNGPGSYTGLRIAASAVKGLVFDQDIQVYAVSTLASYACAALDKHPGSKVHAVIDARRKHLYHAQFSMDRGLEQLFAPRVALLEEVEEQLEPGDVLVGTGMNRLAEVAKEGVALLDSSAISAVSVFELFGQPNFKEFCELTKAEELDPDYLSTGQINNSGTSGRE